MPSTWSVTLLSNTSVPRSIIFFLQLVMQAASGAPQAHALLLLFLQQGHPALSSVIQSLT
jgi:hypothetical protein